MVYLPTIWLFFGVNVGKYTIHGSWILWVRVYTSHNWFSVGFDWRLLCFWLISSGEVFEHLPRFCLEEGWDN